jgi:dCTP deaminase
MSILTREQIVERIEKGEIAFSPEIDTCQLKLHAVDLRLSFTFLIPKAWHMTKKGREALNIDHFDKNHPDYFDVVTIKPGQYFELLPGEHVLVSTLEAVKVPGDLMAVLYPRSSTNRRGLSVDLTGIIDSGYEGTLMIPVRNSTNSQIIKLYPGERFCQVVFELLAAPAHDISGQTSRYHNQDFTKGYIRNNKALGGSDEVEQAYIIKGDIKGLKKRFPLKKK